ncbi:alpha/beta fold hydrolase [Rudanella paleaurantiibacter]|uniref:Alpha/beta fold hydrolase n=1 Tax=Rudanella paleaurantiibacter TaxID=2614655 RepID=A0A7J5TUS6_9BACT|nr:alpha/beta fold hydrolase [Rudanella paleaurantiibacter]KAB7727673.1 alpha/beta fold hydrolase [Rudanella paleaurantiibacter]
MPYVTHDRVKPPVYLWNGHLQTIWPSMARRVDGVTYERERIDTPDNDFLLLDWARRGNRRLGIVAHGLEGDAHRPYLKGMVKALNGAGWDALGWNFRSCAGEQNRLRTSYHIGKSDDLDLIVRRVVASGAYDEVALLGFSAGGNMTLKYAGEQGANIPSLIKRVVTFSVPLDLDAVANHFKRLSNRIYDKRFLKTLIAKVREKATQHDIDLSYIDRIKTMRDFDEYYSGPIHGFKDADDYYAHNASMYFLDKITVPTLILNAQNDPFLPEECYNPALVANAPAVTLEIPRHGGHCGFSHHSLNRCWAEERAVAFLESGV